MRLAWIAAILEVELSGYCDGPPAERSDKLLGQRRAQAVERALGKRGVKPGILTTKGHGAELPIVDEATEKGRKANRRVELHVLRQAPR